MEAHYIQRTHIRLYNRRGAALLIDLSFHGKSVTYAPDLYKVGNKWYPYVDSCIHLSCNDGIGYDYDNNMWRCCTDFNCP